MIPSLRFKFYKVELPLFIAQRKQLRDEIKKLKYLLNKKQVEFNQLDKKIKLRQKYVS